MSDYLDFFNDEILSNSSLNDINIFLPENFLTIDITKPETLSPQTAQNPTNANSIRFVTVKKSLNLVGRKRKQNHQIFDDYDSIHNKFRTDNIQTKIQVDYMKFLVDFINEVLKQMRIKGKFSYIDYSIKKCVNKKYIAFLKSLNIGQVLLLGISPKYNEKNTNINLYKEIIKNPVINNILSENYMTIFKDIYLKSERIINMYKFGLNEIFQLSIKVKMFNDLITRMKKKYGEGTPDCLEYIDSLNKGANYY